MFNINENFPDEQNFSNNEMKYVRQCIRNDLTNIPRFLIPNKNEIKNVLIDYTIFKNEYVNVGIINIISNIEKIIALTYSFTSEATLSISKSKINQDGIIFPQGIILDISYNQVLDKLNSVDFSNVNLNTISPNGYLIQHMGIFGYKEKIHINNENIKGSLTKTNDENLSRVKLIPHTIDTLKKVIAASCIRHFACHIENNRKSCLPLWIIIKHNLTIKDVYDEIGLNMYDDYYMCYKITNTNDDNIYQTIKNNEIPNINKILLSGYLVQFSVDQLELIKINNDNKIVTIKRPDNEKLNKIVCGLTNGTPFFQYKISLLWIYTYIIDSYKTEAYNCGWPSDININLLFDNNQAILSTNFQRIDKKSKNEIMELKKKIKFRGNIIIYNICNAWKKEPFKTVAGIITFFISVVAIVLSIIKYTNGKS